MSNAIRWRSTGPDGSTHEWARKPENENAVEIAWGDDAGQWAVHHGDCLDVMPTLDAGSIDSIVSDPPYGLAFMGKMWDHGVPGVHFWARANRVAKPGAHLLAFGGTRTFHRLTCAIEDAGWEIRDCLSWLYGSGFPKSHNGAWGGTALKPGWEPVILARKPLIGTVAANHAAHGTGALNIDGCRVASHDGATTARTRAMVHDTAAPFGRGALMGGDGSPLGRWPANVALDEEAAAMLDESVGSLTSGKPVGMRGDHYDRNAYGEWGSIPITGFGDTGGASRFFYTAKASRSEREAGLDGPERDKAKWSSGDKSPGTLQSENTKRTARNTHPTVKPVDLMRWLVRLVTPVGGLVLDPFLGSGTTGVAALEEGCRFIGIEREAEYVAIARARIEAAARAPMLDFGNASV